MNTCNKTILVIDDNGINRVIPGLILRPFGWSVCEVDSGFEALNILKVSMFSYILLDISMPNISGVDIVLYLKANKEYENIKCIAYTAYANVSDVNYFLDIGFDAVLLKPLTSKKLLCVLDSIES